MARLSRDSLLRLGVFVTTVVVVVAGASAAPLLADRGIQPQDHPAYETGLVPEKAPAEGQVGLEPTGDQGTIVIDAGHVNRFDRDEIQPLVEAITSAGYTVEFVQSATSIKAAVKGADGLVVIDPGLEYSPSEVTAVERFVASGGRLVMLGEPPRTQITGGPISLSIRTIRSQLDSLAAAFGIEFGEAYLFNTEANDGNFRNIFTRPRGGSPLIEGVDRTAFYTATPVTASDGETILQTGDRTRLVSGDTPGQYAVAVRSGNVLAIGDKTFLADNNFNVVDNDRFIENIARFLIGGDRRQTLLDYPALVGESPTVRYTKVSFYSPARRIANHLRDNGQDASLSLRRGAGAADGADVLITTYDYLEATPLGIRTLTVANGRVSVRGYESAQTGVITLHAPRTGPALVVVVDGPSRARRAAALLTSGDFDQYAVNDRSAVLRTASAGPATGGDALNRSGS